LPFTRNRLRTSRN